MARRLRIRFILVAMCAVFVVLSLFVGAVNAVNYVSINRDAENMIRYIYENGGTIPEPNKKNLSGEQPTGEMPHMNDKRFKELDGEARFRTRFFTVTLDENGNSVEAKTENIASVTQSRAAELAENAYKSGKTQGKSGDFRYSIFTESGGSCAVFLDRSYENSQAKDMLTQSVVVSLVGMGIMLVIIFFLSPVAIAPFIENAQKQKSFITNASHEIKTPLAIISANADVLLLDDPKNDFLISIKKQTKRLSALVADLVTLSKADEGKIAAAKNRIDLSSIASATAVDFEPVANAKNKELNIDCDDGIFISGDADSIERLVSILLDNAVKYAVDGSAISLTLVKTQKDAVMSVSNYCEELSHDDVKHVFDRFWRADASRSRKTGGYGIGLSLAQSIVKTHGGSITASLKSSVITFTVRLPLN